MALTQAQLRDHAGRLILRGIAATIRQDEQLSAQNILPWIWAHRDDTGFSTAPDRNEAVGIILRQIFNRTTDLDAAVNKRIFRKWVDDQFGYGNGITIEPQGQ